MKLKRMAIMIALFSTILTGCGGERPYDFSSSKIVLGLECDYAPFNWESASKSTYGVKISNSQSYCDGYDIRVASHVAQDLGKELVVKKMAFDGLIPALRSSNIDLVIAGMSPTPERQKAIAFSDQYYYSQQTIIVRATSTYANATSLADFAGAKIVAQISTLQDELIDQIPGVIHSLPASTYPEMVAQVKNNVADGLIAELPVAKAIIRNNPSLMIITFQEGSGFTLTNDQVSVAVGLRKVDEELKEKVNQSLAKLSTQTREEWMEEAVIASENA